MTYHWMYSKRHTTGATSGAESYPSGLQCDSCCLLDVLFSVQCFVDHCLSFFVFQPLYCLSVDLQRLFTPLVSSSFQAIILSVRRFTSSVYSFSIFKLQAIILSVRRCLFTPLVSSSIQAIILSVRRFTSSVYFFSIFKLQAIILSVRRCLSTPLVSSSFTYTATVIILCNIYWGK